MPRNFIRIVTADSITPDLPDGAKSAQTISGSWTDETSAPTAATDSTVKSISVEKLEQEMTDFLQNLGQIFDKAEQATQTTEHKLGLQLDEIELTIEISGEGEIKLWGLGADKAGRKGAIALKFKRKDLSNPKGTS